MNVPDNLKEFCRGCKIPQYIWMEGGQALYSQDEIFLRASPYITCKNLSICNSLYERLDIHHLRYQLIGDYMLNWGREHTHSGNYHFEFGEINEMFKTNFPEDEELMDDVVGYMWETGMLLEPVITDEDFDIMFGLKYCPNVEEDL